MKRKTRSVMFFVARCSILKHVFLLIRINLVIFAKHFNGTVMSTTQTKNSYLKYPALL